MSRVLSYVQYETVLYYSMFRFGGCPSDCTSDQTIYRISINMSPPIWGRHIVFPIVVCLQGFFLCTSGAVYGPLNQLQNTLFSPSLIKKRNPNQKMNFSNFNNYSIFCHLDVLSFNLKSDDIKLYMNTCTIILDPFAEN